MFEAPVQGNRLEFGDEIWRQKTRVLGLPGGEEIMTLYDEASSAWTDLAGRQKEDPEIGPFADSEFTKWLWNRWDQLEMHNGLLYRRFISNSWYKQHLQLLVPRRCVDNVLYNTLQYTYRNKRRH